jgi:precorrin-6x reductase
VAEPRLPVGDTRVGGFGGVDGLVRWLVEERIDLLIDATPPFAAAISTAAAWAACRSPPSGVITVDNMNAALTWLAPQQAGQAGGKGR